MTQSINRIIIATATTGGTFYPAGVGIGTLINLKPAKTNNITATAINSARSGKHIEIMKP
ncbi:TAXI family TRAP transporter solute-binding subunit [Halodesulfovibrio aestuarii]|uniref:NMT1-like family protein n=1 Tax=Halodesulfovibrio aestuarii TaxID=126333 RepID=A0A8G2CBM5_9BACT|nr:TAXI family TRAP transporter solute-binding subunit [Halodesulfovibrio aestuarii]SHJ60081.1 NMT1-like family protein [Halodesulfovibrio aestuarii]